MSEVVWRFKVLGPLLLERSGVAVPLAGSRQLLLLAVLLRTDGKPLSRDRLVDELWGDSPPASAISALHVHLSKLRRLIGEFLVSEPGGYALRRSAYQLDVDEFDALVEHARAQPEQARALLTRALRLFRGEPLSDVEAEGSVASWRRELEEKRLQTLMLRVDADLAAGATGELLPELRRLVDEHPIEQRLWAQLMLALYRSGRQAEALDVYQRARRALAQELGLDPGELLVRLQRQMLERDPALLVEARPRPREPKGSSLPMPARRLIGREGELTALTALASDPDVRVITLTGAGGVGKTRLALELARLQEGHYAAGALFVRLEQVHDPGLVGAEVADALSRREETTPVAADRLTSYLQSRELLLVLDNFEQLLAGAPLVSELTAYAPNVRVLVTSRAPLRIRGEHVFEVEPLELPTGDSEPEVALSPAVELFIECALAVSRKLQIDSELLRLVVDICRGLDGLPLAIELAASRLGTLTASEVHEQLARPLSIGERALRDLPDRQQTTEATIRWSYDLLESDDREALRCAATFVGSFSVQALEAVLGRAAGRALETLVDASLIVRHGRDDRYSLRGLVRAFAAGELSRSGEAERARERHRRYFCNLVGSAAEEFDGGRAARELAAPLLADLANLRAALEDAIEAGDAECALTLGLALRPLWLVGFAREAEQLVDRLLARFRVPSHQEMALLSAATLAQWHPREGLVRLAARARQLGDAETLTIATVALLAEAFNARDLDEIGLLKPPLVELMTPDTGAKALGWIHYCLALVDYVEGQLDAADEHARVSAEQALASGNEIGLAGVVATRLLITSTRDHVIGHSQLSYALELIRRTPGKQLATLGLWLVARYAASVAPETAGGWLAHAERIVTDSGAPTWPESILRDETMVVLGIDDLTPWLQSTPRLYHLEAVDVAAEWLAGRDPAEQALRPVLDQSVVSRTETVD